MNVLLTGGTGFLGSRLAERFMGLGLKCANLARAHSNSTKRTRSVTGLIDYVTTPPKKDPTIYDYFKK